MRTFQKYNVKCLFLASNWMTKLNLFPSFLAYRVTSNTHTKLLYGRRALLELADSPSFGIAQWENNEQILNSLKQIRNPNFKAFISTSWGIKFQNIHWLNLILPPKIVGQEWTTLDSVQWKSLLVLKNICDNAVIFFLANFLDNIFFPAWSHWCTLTDQSLFANYNLSLPFKTSLHMEPQHLATMPCLVFLSPAISGIESACFGLVTEKWILTIHNH